VDLAGLRDAIADQGGDPAKVNPVVPVQLIVDHSLAVECGGFDPEAFAEEPRHRGPPQRRPLPLHRTGPRRAFDNVDVIPAGNGIMHQINLEKMSPVVHAQNGVAYPDTCVGTDSAHPARRCAGRDRGRRGRPGSRERDARSRLVDAPARKSSASS
jgi:aconitase A